MCLPDVSKNKHWRLLDSVLMFDRATFKFAVPRLLIHIFIMCSALLLCTSTAQLSDDNNAVCYLLIVIYTLQCMECDVVSCFISNCLLVRLKLNRCHRPADTELP